MSEITEGMIERAAEGILNAQVCADTNRPLSARRYAKAALEAVPSGRVVATLPTREQVWDCIAMVRDARPRAYGDAPTDDIIDALVDRGYLKVREP